MIPTGIKCLDDIGGIPEGSLTEIVGVAGVGKTALLYQIVANYLLEFPRGYVVWLDVDGVFNPDRLLEVFEILGKQAVGQKAARRVFVVERPESYKRVLRVLRNLRPGAQMNLTVIDSVTKLFSEEILSLADKEPKHYIDAIVELGRGLRNLLGRYTIIVTNQARGFLVGSNGLYDTFWETEGVIPALGKLWEYFVDERIYVKRLRRDLRVFVVYFSSTRPETFCTVKYLEGFFK